MFGYGCHCQLGHGDKNGRDAPVEVGAAALPRSQDRHRAAKDIRHLNKTRHNRQLLRRTGLATPAKRRRPCADLAPHVETPTASPRSPA